MGGRELPSLRLKAWNLCCTMMRSAEGGSGNEEEKESKRKSFRVKWCRLSKRGLPRVVSVGTERVLGGGSPLCCVLFS